MVLKLCTLIALLLAVPVCAQDTAAGNQPANAIPVRCVNTLGTAFEACGGGGAAGTDVNISGVGGVPVAPGGPISVNFTNTTLAVTGTFFQATQPVSLASVPSHDVTNAGTFAVQASLAAETTKVIGAVNQGTSPWTVNLISGFALESSQLTGNGSLASIETNTDPLVTSGAGGYVRQDSTATIAKESGGNLATLVTNTTGLVSAGNSSTALLANDAIFTGTYESVKSTAYVTVSVFADQASATDGLIFDWSHDGSNTDRSEASGLNASVGRAFALVPRAQYFRVRYTNGSTTQGTFRLGVVYHPSGTGIISKPLDGTLTTENFAETTQAVLAVKDPSGSGFSNVVTGPGGSGNGVPRVTIATDVVVATRMSPGLPLPLCNAVRRTNCAPKGW